MVNSNSPLPCPFFYYEFFPNAKTLDEWEVIDIGNMFRENIDWVNRFKDETVLSTWKIQIKQQLNPTSTTVEALIALIIQDFNWIIDMEQKISPFKISIDDKIIYCDESISDDLHEHFLEQVHDFRTSFEEVNYRPGSNKTVIDLVDPLLYPLHYGITPILKENNNVEISEYVYTKIDLKEVENWGISEDYQLLPSRLTYNSALDKFEIKSYINNLHPIKYKSLYGSIESIFNQVLSGSNYVLSRYASEDYLRIDWRMDSLYEEKYIGEWQPYVDGKIYQEFDNGKLKYLNPPKIADKGPIIDVPLDLKSFGDIKVIIKLVDIELTPSNPYYNGSDWRVEGLINEDIVTTIHYYYDVENITDSTISFKTGFDDPPYKGTDSSFCEQLYGIKHGQIMTRDIGKVNIKRGRTIIFPNIFQHCSDPFTLKDNTRPGHRRMLAFYIVDPHNTAVIATDRVPVQQQRWWEDGTNVLSQETISKIKQLQNNLPQCLEQAKQERQEIIERSAVVTEADIEYHPHLRGFILRTDSENDFPI